MSETPSDRVFVIANPQAGHARLGRDWDARVHPTLRKHIGAFDHAFTAAPGDAIRLSRDAAARGYRTILSCGGDGTLNEIVNGLFGDGRNLFPDVHVGILPFGSGGDFLRTLGTSRCFAKAAAQIPSARAVPVDVGLVRYDDASLTSRHFLNIANAGVVANVMIKVNATPRWLPSMLRYLWGTVSGFLSYDLQRVRLTFDGGREREVNLTDLLVANGRYFGSGMQPAPHADPADGLFDVVILKDATLARFSRILPRLYTGKFRPSSDVHELLRCRSVRLEPLTDASAPLIEMDGETHGRGGVTLTILPSALKILAG